MDTKPISECTVGELREIIRDAMVDFPPVKRSEPVPNVAKLLRDLDMQREQIECNSRAIDKLNQRLNQAASVVRHCPQIAAELNQLKTKKEEHPNESNQTDV